MRQTGFGPIGGEYYDEEDDNGNLGVAVLWSGKTVERKYEDRSGLTKIIFTDGSWADLYNRTCSNAGPGGLVMCDLAENIIAR